MLRTPSNTPSLHYSNTPIVPKESAMFSMPIVNLARRRPQARRDRPARQRALATRRHPGLSRARPRIPQRVSHQPERRNHAHDQRRNAPALPHAGRQRRNRRDRRRRDHLHPRRHAALAALPARRLRIDLRTKKTNRRDRSISLVLPEMRHTCCTKRVSS